ncbi:Nucleoside-diphosphate-sugar epimerase [Desulfuromusa kysingii]|uniref:Nucleoside-diphosphate-sugar epimerase n=1 Tax=Desulfuromusa kysingii TaxID=37625 RepID=A0A1H4BAB5_9BACT|nr:SDR family oxidoreductase [Desulfuromusa kysingii]SEA44782.1 Nucleoside-diphosphate-sugar epimerase [Desulfuromusa kysingii]
MKILIVGNLGYVGPSVISQLRKSYPDGELIGFDIGYFAHCLTNAAMLPEIKLNKQVFGDIRAFPEELLKGVDGIIDLAAISNDPIGNKFEEVTMDINYRAATNLAEMAKRNGVKSFVYASSCSMYGQADDSPRKETDKLNPLTAYARSKVAAEEALEKLADDNFTVTCHRFATACGWSDRFRLDLVLNDFVAGAIVNKHISILSDGTPWRPMINTKDMARAMDWAITRSSSNGGHFLAVNSGSNEWNTTMLSLAEATAEVIPGVDISVNPDAPPDKRSYRANFDLFKQLAPNHQPSENLTSTITEIKNNLLEMDFHDSQYRESQLMRLHVIGRLQKHGKLNDQLQWII